MAISTQMLLCAIAFPDGNLRHFLSKELSEDDIKTIRETIDSIPYNGAYGQNNTDDLSDYINKLRKTIREKLNIEICPIIISEIFRKHNTSEHVITKNMLKAGYEKGIVKLIDSPHHDGTVCEIGEHWFYFGGQTAEDLTAKEYEKYVPKENIIDEIFAVLDDARCGDRPISEDEYLYYEAILRESDCT